MNPDLHVYKGLHLMIITKHTSVVPLNSVIYVNIFGIVTPMLGTQRCTLHNHKKAHKFGFIEY